MPLHRCGVRASCVVRRPPLGRGMNGLLPVLSQMRALADAARVAPSSRDIRDRTQYLLLSEGAALPPADGRASGWDQGRRPTGSSLGCASSNADWNDALTGPSVVPNLPKPTNAAHSGFAHQRARRMAAMRARRACASWQDDVGRGNRQPRLACDISTAILARDAVAGFEAAPLSKHECAARQFAFRRYCELFCRRDDERWDRRDGGLRTRGCIGGTAIERALLPARA